MSSPPVERRARPLSLAELLFNAAGRLSRASFVGPGVGLAAASLALGRGASGRWARSAAWIARAPLATSLGCIVSKRLHDRGWSGWWSGPILLAWAFAARTPRGRVGRAALSAFGAAVIVLALVPGDGRFNRYGPRP